jgi:hypothetical protein
MKDSEIKKIVRRVISEEVNEGSTWEGVKGFFRGKGYYYTKYLTELEYILEEMEKEIVSNAKIERKLEKLKNKVESSSIEKDKKDNIKIMFNRTQQVIQYADRLIQNELYNLKRLKDY